MSERMRVVTAWVDGDDNRHVMRDDGVVFFFNFARGEWETDGIAVPVPACEATDVRLSMNGLEHRDNHFIDSPILSGDERRIVAEALHRYQTSTSGLHREQAERLWKRFAE